MGQSMRVSLPGYDALTDTDQDHYALFADEDWVLVKELYPSGRGSVSVPSGQIRSVTHDLGYVPFVMAFYNQDNIWKSCVGNIIDYSYAASGDTTSNSNLPFIIVDAIAVYFANYTGSTVGFKYFICYDQQI